MDMRGSTARPIPLAKTAGLSVRAALAKAEIPVHASGVLAFDFEALRRNYRVIKKLADGAETAAVVKADGYGVGAIQAARALWEEGCRTFFVATLAEAQTLRQGWPEAIIYVLNGLTPGSAPAFQAASARPVLNSLSEVNDWASHCLSRGGPLPAALQIDTGMNRLGLSEAEPGALQQNATLLGAFDLALILSHLACADNPAHVKNFDQHRQFASITLGLPKKPRSLANSAGVFLGKAYHYDMVRPGIALYGGRARSTGPNPMEPVVWSYARILKVEEASAGESVGYGATYTLQRKSRLLTVAAGYADGYFRLLSTSNSSQAAYAMLEGYRLPLLGRVSMDLSIFDGTDLPDGLAKRGGFVQLLGDEITVDDVAGWAGTIGYEILTTLSRRFHRVTLDLQV
jgi:alanine racemase